jgi:Phage capsid family
MGYDRQMQITKPLSLVPEDLSADTQRRSLNRAVTALALGTIKKQNAETILRANWPNDARAGVLLKAAVSPLETSGLPGPVGLAPFKSLAPSSATVALFGRGTEVSLIGVSQLAIPSVAAPPQAGFVGEGQPIPNIDFDFAANKIGPLRKLALLATVTGELQVATAETASVIIGRVLSDAVSKSLDRAVFSTDAESEDQPAGLLHGVTAIPAAVVGASAMVQDISELVGSIADHGIDVADIVIIASPRPATVLQLLASPKFAAPILIGSGLSDGTVIAVAPAALTSALGAPRFQTSSAALVHHDSNPAGGALAGPSYSAFQQDLISLKLVSRAAWAIEAGGIAFIQHVAW